MRLLDTSQSQPDSSDADISWVPSKPNFTGNSTIAFTRQRVPDPQDLVAGDIYGDFFIRRELGRGAVGVVYLAEQISLRRSVALKVSTQRSSHLGNQEGSALASLDHPSVVRVYSEFVEPDKERRVLCMQYVPGMTLRELISTVRGQFGDHWCGRDLLTVLDHAVHDPVVMDAASIQERSKLASLSRTEAICWLGSQLALALDYAHRSGIVHGDIKPENIIVNQFGRPMLVDFNLARASFDEQPRLIGGTIPYMAPESLSELYRAVKNSQQPHQSVSDESDDAMDDRTDLYSLGVVLWELFNGCRPFATVDVDKTNCQTELMSVFHEQPSESDLMPASLRTILRRAFHFDPEQRFKTGKAFSGCLVGASQQSNVIRSSSDYGWLGRSVTRFPRKVVDLRWPGSALLRQSAAGHLQRSPSRIATDPLGASKANIQRCFDLFEHRYLRHLCHGGHQETPFGASTSFFARPRHLGRCVGKITSAIASLAGPSRPPGSDWLDVGFAGSSGDRTFVGDAAAPRRIRTFVQLVLVCQCDCRYVRLCPDDGGGGRRLVRYAAW